ncbi:MAG: hypothetical protein ACREOO_11790 [bacterium]
MPCKRLSVLFFMLCLVTTAQAQERGFGLGVILGEPSGISGKSWMTKKTALAGAVAWSLERDEALHVHLDHLFHDFDSMPVEQGTLALYYGFGGRIKFADESTISIRIPIGLNYLFASAPMDLFLEVVPMLDLIPKTEVNLNGGIGIRYFFKTSK